MSKCDKTKKSYFKEGSIKEKEEIITQPATQATESTTVRSTYVAPKTEAEREEEENNENNEDYDNENDEENEYDDGNNDEDYDEDDGNEGEIEPQE